MALMASVLRYCGAATRGRPGPANATVPAMCAGADAPTLKVRRPDTGCLVEMGGSLVPVGIRHGRGCRCVPVHGPDDLERLVAEFEFAVYDGTVRDEKPVVVLANLLLGATRPRWRRARLALQPTGQPAAGGPTGKGE